MELTIQSLAESDVRDVILRWRELASKEVSLGASKSLLRFGNGVRSLTPNYLTNIHRPFFNRLDPCDSIYVRTHRMIVYGMTKYSKALKAVVMKASGKNLGKLLVSKGVIRSLDDLPEVFIAQRIGLLDILSESTNRMRVNIYECISCSGMRPSGITMCDFEAGVIEGVLEVLIGRNVTKERYCWGLGYSFCGFETIFE